MRLFLALKTSKIGIGAEKEKKGYQGGEEQLGEDTEVTAAMQFCGTNVRLA